MSNHKLKHLQKQIQDIAKIIVNQSYRIIGVCGVPGAGKSSFSHKLCQMLNNMSNTDFINLNSINNQSYEKHSVSIVISMDGYHKYKKDLDQQGIIRRGAAFTFDLKRFNNQIIRLSDNQKFKKQNQYQYPLLFPSFDHKQKDPKQNNIKVQKWHKYIIIQGLYIFDKSLEINQNNNFWNIKIWIQGDNQQSLINRLAKRHLVSQIVNNLQDGRKKAKQNDLLNGQYVKQHSVFQQNANSKVKCIKINNFNHIQQ